MPIASGRRSKRCTNATASRAEAARLADLPIDSKAVKPVIAGFFRSLLADFSKLPYQERIFSYGGQPSAPGAMSGRQLLSLTAIYLKTCGAYFAVTRNIPPHHLSPKRARAVAKRGRTEPRAFSEGVGGISKYGGRTGRRATGATIVACGIVIGVLSRRSSWTCPPANGTGGSGLFALSNNHANTVSVGGRKPSTRRTC